MRKNTNIITRNLNSLVNPTGNLYKSTLIITKRAKQINANLKEEVTQKLEDFITVQDDLKEVFENQEQIKISKYYERIPKPSKTATEEFVNGELDFRRKEKLD